jgi:type I restriction enzyme S subunit
MMSKKKEPSHTIHNPQFTTRNLPKLRFPEFRNAGPWEVKRLGEVAGLKAGDFIPASEIHRKYADGLNPCYGGNGLRGFTKSFTHIGEYPLIGRQGAYSGNVQFARGKFHATEHAIVVTPKENSNTKFLYFLLVSAKVSNLVTGQAQPGLSITTLDAVDVALPTEPEEQQKIADCLSSLDELIAHETKRLEALKAHKKGLMQQLFPREGETTPRLRFPEFRNAGPWEVRTLEDLSESIAQGGTPDTSVPDYWNGEIAWITPAEMADDAAHHYTERTLRTITPSGLSNSSAVLLPVNSVIISSRAPIGYVTINKVPMATNQGCKGIVPKKGIYHEFLYFSLLHAKPRLNDLGAGAGFKEISASTLKAFSIAVPDYPEQQKIADCLSSLDELIAHETKKLEALKAHKKGLMQQLFPQEVKP